MVVPVFMADEDGGRGSLSCVGGVEIAPENGMNAEDREKAGGDGGNVRARRLRGSCNGGDEARVLRERLEAAALVAEVIEVRVGEARPRALRVDFEDGHDAARIVIRERPQQ